MVSGPDLTLRERVLEAAYACVARFGLGKTTVEDVAKESGVSRATIYRSFPGGRDELIREVVAWESGRFLGRLAEAAAGAPDLASLLEEALRFAHRAVNEHAVLQKVLATEPERLIPMLTIDSRLLEVTRDFVVPYLEREEAQGRLPTDVDRSDAADYIARMLLSLIGSPGSWDLDDPAEVSRVVREQILAGLAHA